MHEVMIPAAQVGQAAHRSAELAFDDDERFVKTGSSAGSRRRCKIGDQACETRIELTRGRVDSVWSVNVLVIVPAAQRDLDVTRS
jgi:hypothetical protein